jgi:hypothetical protein
MKRQADDAIANKYGSIVSYRSIAAGKIRVFCHGNRPADPLSWPLLLAANDTAIARHD